MSNNFAPMMVHLDFQITKRGRVASDDHKHTNTQRMKDILAARDIKAAKDSLEEPKYKTTTNMIFGGFCNQKRGLAFEENVNFVFVANISNIVRKSISYSAYCHSKFIPSIILYLCLWAVASKKQWSTNRGVFCPLPGVRLPPDCLRVWTTFPLQR